MENEFTISYRLFLKGGKKELHTTKVKNCMNIDYAVIKLRMYLKKKYPLYEDFEVISPEKYSIESFLRGFANW